MTNEERNRYTMMLHQWLILKQEGKNLADYLEKCGYKTVAVYGLGIYGRHVIRELKNTNVKVLYAIDKYEVEPYESVEAVPPSCELPRVDAIINTVIREHALIQSYMEDLVDYPVLSLEDVVFESY